jgi:Holliday junction resolvasome RuvABC endonuclease subunit
MTRPPTVWGVDVAVSHLSIAFAELDTERVGVRSLITGNDTREGERLGRLDRQLRIWGRQLAGEFPPHVIFVEQPSGRFRAPTLVYACGVVQAALFETLGVPVWTIPSGRWKKATVGVGNATKPQVRAWVDTMGYDADSQDEADAICIAVAGRRMLAADDWGVAA